MWHRALRQTMIQFSILTGKKADTVCVPRRFPMHIGRSSTCDLQLEENGVWDRHLTVGLNRDVGFTLETEPDAWASVNDQPVQRAVLRNGDIIQLGSSKLRFWLGEARQRGLRVREGLLWTIVASVSAAQVALIYWLIRW